MAAISHSNPPGSYSGTLRGYSQVVLIENPQQIIYLSGQLPLDADGRVVGPSDIEAQTRQVFENIRIALESGGMGLDRVVKLNGFITDVRKFPPLIRPIRAEYFGTQNPPASTLVEVPRFADPDVLIEIDAIAVR